MSAGAVGKSEARMVEWLDYCSKVRDPVKRQRFFDAGFAELFDRDLSPKLEPLTNNPTCRECGDHGILYADSVQPRRNNTHRRSSPGWKTCRCSHGRARNSAIAESGRPKKAQPRRMREEEF